MNGNLDKFLAVVSGIEQSGLAVERMRLALSWIARMPEHRAQHAPAIARAVLLGEEVRLPCESRRFRYDCDAAATTVVDGPLILRHACCGDCCRQWIKLDGYVAGPLPAMFPGLDKLRLPV